MFGDGHYSAPYETLVLLVLYRLATPKQICCDMEEFFGFRRSKISAGIKAMASAMNTLALKYLDDTSIFVDPMPRYVEMINEKCGLVNTVWEFIDGTLRKIVDRRTFKSLCTVVTNALTA